MSTTTAAPLDFYRVEAGEYACGPYTVIREATTFGIGRASNPMWAVYLNGERLGRHSTLARAKRHVERHDAENPAVETATLPAAREGAALAHEGAVVLARADWDMIARAVVAARSGEPLDADVEAHLAAMTFVEVVAQAASEQIEPQVYERLRTMKGRGRQVDTTALVTGDVVRVDGKRYRVQADAATAHVTGSILVDVYSEDNEYDTLVLGPSATVTVLGAL